MGLISASRNTDVPAALDADWLFRKIKEGTVKVLNRFNKTYYNVSLLPEDVDGYVFWSKQPSQKFLENLKTLDKPYYFNFTLNMYPCLEPNLLPLDDRIELFKQVSRQSPIKPVWRYDPLVLSNTHIIHTLLENAKYIGNALKGYTDQMVFSFMIVNAKIKSNLPDDCRTFSAEEQLYFVQRLLELDLPFKIQSCSQIVEGVERSTCVDGQKFGIKHKKHVGQRELCQCSTSRDVVGHRGICRLKCKYCYAV